MKGNKAGGPPLVNPGEEEAFALFNSIFEAYVRQNGPVDESKPPNVEELLAWAEANPHLVYGAVEGVDGQPDSKVKALASIGGVGIGAGAGGAAGPRGGKPGPQSGPGVEIIPSKGFVVKSKDDSGRKVFLNICGSEKIPAPGNWANGKVPQEVEELLEKAAEGDEAASQALRFPLSCGNPRNEVDKEGGPCTVVDLILNIDIVKQAVAYKRLKVFVIELALNWVAQKHNLLLDPKYKLPRRDYFGSSGPEAQYVRSEPKALITEVGDVEEEPTFAFPIGKPKGAKSQPQAQQQRAPAIAPAAASSRPQSAAAAPPKQPAAGSASAAAASRAATPAAAGPGPGRGGGGVLSELPDLPSSITFEGTPVTAVLCRVPLPKGADQSKTATKVLQETLVVEGVSGYASTKIALPFAVDAKKSEAWFERESGGGVALVARLPYRPYADVAAEAKRATVKGLNLKDATYLDLID